MTSDNKLERYMEQMHQRAIDNINVWLLPSSSKFTAEELLDLKLRVTKVAAPEHSYDKHGISSISIHLTHPRAAETFLSFYSFYRGEGVTSEEIEALNRPGCVYVEWGIETREQIPAARQLFQTIFAEFQENEFIIPMIYLRRQDHLIQTCGPGVVHHEFSTIPFHRPKRSICQQLLDPLQSCLQKVLAMCNKQLSSSE